MSTGVLNQAKCLCRLVGQALGLEAEIHHAETHQLDRCRVFEVEIGHGGCRAWAKPFFLLLAQEVAHGHGNIAKIDVDRARFDTAVTDRAMVGNVVEFVKMLQRNAAPGLLFIKEGFDQQRSRENLVARRVEQVGARHVR